MYFHFSVCAPNLRKFDTNKAIRSREAVRHTEGHLCRLLLAVLSSMQQMNGFTEGCSISLHYTASHIAFPHKLFEIILIVQTGPRKSPPACKFFFVCYIIRVLSR